MSETVHVALGDRSYDVSIGAFSPDAIADKVAAALDPKTTGVAVLIDAQVAERSARARELVAALGARLPHVERLELRAGRGLQEPDGDREVVRVAGRPRVRSARRGHRHRRRRRHRPRRLRGGGLPARRAVRAGADDAAGDGRRVGGRQDRRRSRRRQEPGRRVPPAARGRRRRRLPGDAARARADRRARRGGQVRLHRRRGPAGPARAERPGPRPSRSTRR